ncbi:hypothetical protein [Halochromatium roseum]|uniref:hypothetical protein n=1 Tax=Halochromatium roseum TaxID=391920 RepID=UPI00191433A3|nr:hypothetical protein [Halochromatium roseum]
MIDPENILRSSGKSQFAELPPDGHEPANAEDYADILARFISKALGELVEYEV